MRGTLLTIIAAFILSFSAPLFFIGRAGYKVRGYMGSLIIGAFSFAAAYLVAIAPIANATAGLNGYLSSLINALVYSLSSALAIALSRLLTKQINPDLRLGFAIGSGQAIASSAMFVLIPYFNSALYLILYSNGTLLPRLLEMGLDEASANVFITELLSVPSYSYILSGAERFVLSMAHIASSLFYGKYMALKKSGIAYLILFAPLFISYFILGALGAAGDFSLSYVLVTLLTVMSMSLLVYMSRRNKESKKDISFA